VLSVDGDADAAVENRIRIGWNKFRQLVPLVTSWVRSSMLHGSETWPSRKENDLALQQTEMIMVRRLCGIKLKDRVPSKEMRERESRIR